MNFELKDYQEIAVGQLVSSVSGLLSKGLDDSLCVFQSPTGSGKTVIVAKFIERLINECPNDDLCFLWLSVGKGELHKQSKRSLEKIFEGAPRCVLVEEEFAGSRDIILRNNVVVVNWEKLWDKDRQGNWKAKLMHDGESVNFPEIIENTKLKRKIVLIIDESHFAAEGQRTNELREIIAADVTLEMSATPKMLGIDTNFLLSVPIPFPFAANGSYIRVDPQEVIAQGMIKKELIINEGINEIAAGIEEATSERIILEAAYQKRLEQKTAFESEESNVNPLCLIQLPNADEGQEKRDRIEAFLKEKDITEENEKLAIWLSGDKSDFIDRISENDNEIEFLIFKQAIDTGWDCPRASILVKLREVGTYTFEVQTVGRILRMPELKHYEQKEILNVGNIYSNLATLTVKKEDYNPNIIKSIKAKRKPIYEPLGLISYYKSRVDYGDITLSFYSVLERIFRDKLGLADDATFYQQNIDKVTKLGINFEASEYQVYILENVHIPSGRFDDLVGVVDGDVSERLEVKLSDADLYDVFNEVVRSQLNGFPPRRSIPTVRSAVYQAFKNCFGIDPRAPNGAIQIQRIFLANVKNFALIVGTATGEYRPVKKEEAKKRITEDFYEWDVKAEEYYNEYDVLRPNVRNIYDKCYLKIDRSKLERDFEDHLENENSNAVWWYKNGDNGRDYFGIKYEENEMPQTFYPDFIIAFASGRIGIFDTKCGNTANEAKLKAEALAGYIKEQNEKGMNLVGGIVTQDQTGDWKYNQRSAYSYDLNDFREWDRFDEIQ